MLIGLFRASETSAVIESTDEERVQSTTVSILDSWLWFTWYIVFPNKTLFKG